MINPQGQEKEDRIFTFMFSSDLMHDIPTPNKNLPFEITKSYHIRETSILWEWISNTKKCFLNKAASTWNQHIAILLTSRSLPAEASKCLFASLLLRMQSNTKRTCSVLNKLYEHFEESDFKISKWGCLLPIILNNLSWKKKRIIILLMNAR